MQQIGLSLHLISANKINMKSIKTFIRAIAAIGIIAASVSCKHDDTLVYNNLTMGNIVDGTFVSDMGNIFNVTENPCYKDLGTMNRALVLCDVLNKVEGTDNEYDIRLNAATEVLVKKPVTKFVADNDKDMTTEDPIDITYLWISGGYINTYLMFEFKYDTQTPQKHLINLVYDQENSKDGKYEFIMRHNAFGETASNDATGITFGGNYVSFPISDIIKEDSAEIIIKCRWYKTISGGIMSDLQEKSFNIQYIRGGFEHAPRAVISNTSF